MNYAIGLQGERQKEKGTMQLQRRKADRKMRQMDRQVDGQADRHAKLPPMHN